MFFSAVSADSFDGSVGVQLYLKHLRVAYGFSGVSSILTKASQPRAGKAHMTLSQHVGFLFFDYQHGAEALK